MHSDRDLELAAQQLEKLRLDGEAYHKSQAGVLEKYAALMEDFKRLKSDYEEERDTRERYKQLAKGQERNPFVLVRPTHEFQKPHMSLRTGASRHDCRTERLDHIRTSSGLLSMYQSFRKVSHGVHTKTDLTLLSRCWPTMRRRIYTYTGAECGKMAYGKHAVERNQ